MYLGLTYCFVEMRVYYTKVGNGAVYRKGTRGGSEGKWYDGNSWIEWSGGSPHEGS